MKSPQATSLRAFFMAEPRNLPVRAA